MPIRLVFIDSIEILSFNIILSKWIDNLISKMLYDMRVELTAGGLWLYEFDADSETNCVFFFGQCQSNTLCSIIILYAPI